MMVLSFFLHFKKVIMKKVAVLVDGGFFISRVLFTARKYYKNHNFTSDQLIKIYWNIVNFHCTYKQRDEMEDTYYLQIRKSIRSLNLVIAHLKVLILKHILHMSCEENYTQL